VALNIVMFSGGSTPAPPACLLPIWMVSRAIPTPPTTDPGTPTTPATGRSRVAGYDAGYFIGYDAGYFGGGGLIIPATPTPDAGPATTFVGAIGRALEADGALAALLAGLAASAGRPGAGYDCGYFAGFDAGYFGGGGSVVAGSGAGGSGSGSAVPKVWHVAAPARTPSPWVVFWVPKLPATRINSATYLTDGRIMIRAFADSRAVAAKVADRARAAVLAAYRADRMQFPEGRLMDVSIVDADGPGMPAPSRPAGRNWSEVRALAFEYQPA
jgi:hypothetical protein